MNLSNYDPVTFPADYFAMCTGFVSEKMYLKFYFVNFQLKLNDNNEIFLFSLLRS